MCFIQHLQELRVQANDSRMLDDHHEGDGKKTEGQFLNVARDFFFFNEISKALGFRGLDSILRTSSPQLSLTIVPGYLMFYSGLCRHWAHTQHIKTYMQAKRPYPFFKLKKKNNWNISCRLVTILTLPWKWPIQKLSICSQKTEMEIFLWGVDGVYHTLLQMLWEKGKIPFFKKATHDPY